MSTSLDKHLSFIIEELSDKDSINSIDVRWKNILQKIFENAQINHVSLSTESCRLLNNNSVIQVPTIESNECYEIHNQDAASTFDENDIQLASSLLTLCHQFISVQQAVEKGASDERQRIARDLHDDVAARILTLIHKAKDQESINLARSILKSLRNSIYTLDNKATTTILDALTDIRSELQDRLNSIGSQIFWSQCDALDELIFTPRQHINLQRILHEIVTNVIRHAHADYVTMDINLKNDQFHVHAFDNGTGFDIEECIPGKGLNNIATRVKELNGNCSWNNFDTENEATGSCIDITFPITIK